MIQKRFLQIIKIIIFPGYLTDISAKKEAPPFRTYTVAALAANRKAEREVTRSMGPKKVKCTVICCTYIVALYKLCTELSRLHDSMHRLRIAPGSAASDALVNSGPGEGTSLPVDCSVVVLAEIFVMSPPTLLTCIIILISLGSKHPKNTLFHLENKIAGGLEGRSTNVLF